MNSSRYKRSRESGALNRPGRSTPSQTYDTTDPVSGSIEQHNPQIIYRVPVVNGTSGNTNYSERAPRIRCSGAVVTRCSGTCDMGHFRDARGCRCRAGCSFGTVRHSGRVEPELCCGRTAVHEPTNIAVGPRRWSLISAADTSGSCSSTRPLVRHTETNGTSPTSRPIPTIAHPAVRFRFRISKDSRPCPNPRRAGSPHGLLAVSGGGGAGVLGRFRDVSGDRSSWDVAALPQVPTGRMDVPLSQPAETQQLRRQSAD